MSLDANACSYLTWFVSEDNSFYNNSDLLKKQMLLCLLRLVEQFILVSDAVHQS